MPELSAPWDVAVIGGGNAALCAAISARQAGARVLLLEHAPRELRGGNSRHTRNLRLMHDAPTEVLTDRYDESEFWDDLLRVTGGQTDEQLARATIRNSGRATAFMEACGVRFQPALSGTLSLSRTNAFFLGGGKALVNAYYRTAARIGVEVAYGAEVTEIHLDGRRVTALVVEREGRRYVVAPKTVIAASGGFQANLDWLREIWGPAADNFLIRGTPFARGTVLRALLDQGCAAVGDPSQGHAVAIDARAPKFDGGIVTRLDCVPYGVVVNKAAQRFYDEGEDLWPKRYAIWGRLVAQQEDQIAFAIVDAKAEPLFMPSVFPPETAATIEELAKKLGLEPLALRASIDGFNASVREGDFRPAELDDGCRTEGLTPPKTRWARRIDTPPFSGYPLRPGITFTYLGVKVDENAQVQMDQGQGVDNLWACGEIMAGNVLGRGYLAGLGMTIGTVFGRLSGQEASRYAQR